MTTLLKMNSLETLLKIEQERIKYLNLSYEKTAKDLETVGRLRDESLRYSEQLMAVLDRQKRERAEIDSENMTSQASPPVTVTPPSNPPSRPSKRSRPFQPLIFDAKGKHYPSQPNNKADEPRMTIQMIADHYMKNKASRSTATSSNQLPSNLKRSARAKSQQETSTFPLQRCVSCNLLPRYKNRDTCLQCSNVSLSKDRCITINETGKNKGKQCLLPREVGRQMCKKHLEDFIDVTKSDDSDSDDEEEHKENDSIVVADHTSQGSLSESEQEFLFTDSEGEDERPLKRFRQNFL